MSRLFYPKLAAVNLRKNARTYFPYLLTCIFSVAAFYIMGSIGQNPGLSSLRGADTVSMMLFFGTIVIGIFSLIFLFYTNSFLIKRRKKELGLYNILGMEKKHIARVLTFEMLIVAVISLTLGLLGGMLLSKLLFLLLLNVLGIQTSIAFMVSVPMIVTTILLFGGIFLLTLLSNLLQVKLSNPINLLKGGQTGEKEPRSSIILTILGVLSMGGGYWIALTVKDPVTALSLFFLAVILVIIGTYCLFTSGSIAVLKLLRKNKRFYYKRKNFIPVSGMIYRMKQNAVGLANICILSTMVLVTVSTTVSLFVGQQDILDSRYPRDYAISVTDSEENRQKVDELMHKHADDAGVNPVGVVRYRSFKLALYQQENSFLTDIPSDAQTSSALQHVVAVTFVPLEDYNQVANTSLALNDGEAMVYSSNPDFNLTSMTFGGKTVQVKEKLTAMPFAQFTPEMVSDNLYVVVKDLDTVKSIRDALVGKPDYIPLFTIYNRDVAYNLEFDLNGRDNAIIGFAQSLEQDIRATFKDTTRNVDSYHLKQDEFKSLYGGFFFLGIFLGLLFLMATVLIIYYKQISEGYDDHDRFDIMQKVGMSRQEVKQSIRRQILMVFFLPLVVAEIHLAAAMPVILKLLLMFGMTKTWLVLTCAGVTLLMFVVFYLLIYSLTAKAYYRLVQR